MKAKDLQVGDTHEMSVGNSATVVSIRTSEEGLGAYRIQWDNGNIDTCWGGDVLERGTVHRNGVQIYPEIEYFCNECGDPIDGSTNICSICMDRGCRE